MFRAICGIGLAMTLLGCGSPTPASSSTQGAGGSGGSGGAGGGGGQGGAPAFDAVAHLEKYLTGKFDSSDDAANNPNHFAILLTTCATEVPALGERILYVEQAAMDTPDNPYRQRVYVLEPGMDPTTQARSRIFEFDQPGAFTGHCINPAKTITTDLIAEKPGCAVDLTYDKATDTFTGGTTGKDCASSLNGATYATSKVTLDATQLQSWDQGFDGMDVQVWGATDGPYIFARKTPVEP
jgi:CpeT protein